MPREFKPRCVALPEGLRYPKVVVRRIAHHEQVLEIDLQGDGFSFARLTFEDVLGFRVLDERELCEFWNTYSTPSGWLYEVLEGGFLELERTRAKFDVMEIPGLREFMIMDYACVNVLCVHPPRLEQLGTDPSRTEGEAPSRSRCDRPDQAASSTAPARARTRRLPDRGP